MLFSDFGALLVSGHHPRSASQTLDPCLESILCFRSVKQTESLISFLQVVKILRDAIKWPSNPDAQKELRSWDDHMQWCTSSNSTPEDVNSLLQSVKAFSRALKIEERLKPNVEDIGEDELIPSLPDVSPPSEISSRKVLHGKIYSSKLFDVSTDFHWIDFAMGSPLHLHK